jgi:hypothetical protein
MILLDAIFIIELFLKTNQKKKKTKNTKERRRAKNTKERRRM